MQLKHLTAALLLATASLSAKADEGMWLMTQFEQSVYPQMKKLGLKMKPGEIYNEADVALSDAVVAIDGGSCTGSIVSSQGLLITNHHCAYGDIHSASTDERNYLHDGFWAASREEEIPVPGKTVQFLRRVVDVTPEAREELEKMKDFKGMKNRRLARTLEDKYAKESGLQAQLGIMWKGEQYLMFLYDEYKDVRLVAAPPESIGAFGGEQDNWQWPQHKGDFAMYRIYTAPDGSPAAYSADNVPLRPRRVLDISTRGIAEGDYTMIIGYPGRVHRYTSSFEVGEKQQINNPVSVEMRREKLNIWKKYMDADPSVRLKYANRYFGISNITDYARWENKCFYRFDVKAQREAEEAELDAWLKADPERVAKYGDLIANMRLAYRVREEVVRNRAWYREGFAACSDLLNSARRLSSFAASVRKEGRSVVAPGDSLLTQFLDRMDLALYDKTDMEADREVMGTLLGAYLRHVPDSLMGDNLNRLVANFDGNAHRIADYIYSTSILGDRDRLHAYFATERQLDEFLEDPALMLAESANVLVFNEAQTAIEEETGLKGSDLDTDYVHALYEMRRDKGRPQYPDANSTMRLTYGTVGGIRPSDGIAYDAQTTIQGYLDKCDQSDYEFRVDSTMLRLIADKDFGRWAAGGTLPVNFLTNHDITGGNLGSPVLNAKGQLVGLAFDGNREGMAGDVFFHPTLSKTVCVDIRFVLWIIEKYGSAGYLLEEMGI